MSDKICYQAGSTTLPIIQDKQTVQYVDINVVGDGSCLLTAALGGVFFNAFNSNYQMPEWLYKEILKRSYALNDLDNLSQYNQLKRNDNLGLLSPYNRLKRAAQAPEATENNLNKIHQIKKVYQFIVDAQDSQFSQQQFMAFARQLVQEPEGWSALLECLAPAIRHIVLDHFKKKINEPTKLDISDIVLLESDGFVQATYTSTGDQILTITLTEEFATLYGHPEHGDTRWLGQAELRSFGQLFNTEVGIYNPTISTPVDPFLSLKFAPIYKDKVNDQTIILLKKSDHYHLGINAEIYKNASIDFSKPIKPVSDYRPMSLDKAKSPTTKISSSSSLNIIEDQVEETKYAKQEINSYENFVASKDKNLDKDGEHVINILLNQSLDKIFNEDDTPIEIDKLSAEEKAKAKIKEKENKKKVKDIFATAKEFYDNFAQTSKEDEPGLRNLYGQFNKYQRVGTFFKSRIELQPEQRKTNNNKNENEGESDNSSVFKSVCSN